ncbi:MAG TPA: hypothetical protein VF089_20470, partial [Candidatus Binatia bacterium]
GKGLVPPINPSAGHARLSANNPIPTFFQTGAAREPYNRGQWGSALKATPQATMSDVIDGRGLQTTSPFTCPRFPASLASLSD